MNRKLIPYLLLLFVFLFHPGINGAGTSHKPLPPLRISIVPVQSGITPDQIKPGDAIEFKIAAVSSIDVPNMSIKVNFSGGAKLVSGDTSWSGPAAKNEEKAIMLTVRAPKTGKGRIRAWVTIPPSDGARFSAGAQYVMGSDAERKPEQEQPVKKDSKGRSVVEYR
jgi:hypothetical protein